jgi:hypothetical protein
MTGRLHQLVMDLDGGSHWVEWVAPADAQAGAAPAAGPQRVAMTPPLAAMGPREFEPVPGPFGRPHPLGDDARIVAVALPDGELSRGLVTLQLGPDGSTEPAVIRVSDPDGRHPVDVEVEALADAVRVVDVGR